MVQPSLMLIRFGEFELDEERFQLRRCDGRVAVRPKVFDLLVLLVRSRERVVLRDELVLALWGTTAVGPGSLSGLVNELRQILGEAGRETSSIRTVHARGYQFVAKLEPAEGDGASASVRSIDLVEEENVGPVGHAMDLIRASFERASCSGARAALVNQGAGPGRTALFESAVSALRNAGFETIRLPEATTTTAMATEMSGLVASFIDRLVEALVDRFGIGSLRSKIPARSHELFERSAKTRSVQGHWIADPLAARQYEGRIQRGAAELLRALASDRPIALVFAAPSSPTEDIATGLSELLNRLEDSRVFVLGPILSIDRVGNPESVVGPIDSRIDWIECWEEASPELPVENRDRLNVFLAAHGIAALPSSLADALVAHVRGDATSLEPIASWLCAEVGTDSGNSNGPTTFVEPSRMRRVEPVKHDRRSGFGTR